MSVLVAVLLVAANGQWQFAASSQITSPPTGQTLAETALVPYPITVPTGWSGRHVAPAWG
jgi:hypothetical protein